MYKISKTKLLGLALVICSSHSNAANWLELQGMQPDVVAPKGVKVPYRRKEPVLWGFIQTNWKKDYGKVAYNATNQTTTPFSLLNPGLTGQEGFNVFRARLALRGMADNDNKINYFFMTETGNNGVNNVAGHRETATYFTDASVTVKHIPGMKLRMGMFKTPGSEEGLQAVFVSPYIEFTTMSNQQLLERTARIAGAELPANKSGGATTDHYNLIPSGPVGAYRDTGLQLFDTFDIANGWDISYAYMLGNGSGVSMTADSHNLTHYAYIASEKSFGKGSGYYTESLKLFAWYQNGNRELLDSGTVLKNYNRIRSGAGATYYKSGLRLEAEYMKAAGMIFVGVKDVDTTSNYIQDWQYQFAVDKENEADGYYLNAQYEVIAKKLEVFARFDVLNRLTNDSKAERIFTTTTVGTSYRFKGPTRIDLNYIMKSAEAPDNTGAQAILDNYGNRLAIQLTAAF